MGDRLFEGHSPTNGSVYADRFAGGTLRGVCYQITQGNGPGYVQLTTEQATAVANAILDDVSRRETPPRAICRHCGSRWKVSAVKGSLCGHCGQEAKP